MNMKTILTYTLVLMAVLLVMAGNASAFDAYLMNEDGTSVLPNEINLKPGESITISFHMEDISPEVIGESFEYFSSVMVASGSGHSNDIKVTTPISVVPIWNPYTDIGKITITLDASPVEDTLYYVEIAAANDQYHDMGMIILPINVRVLHEISFPPVCNITSISPNPAVEGETVFFNGNATDPDSFIVAYNWTSSIDGHLSSSLNFNSSNLSVGTHTIYFCAQDDSRVWPDLWSEADSVTLTINEKTTVDEPSDLKATIGDSSDWTRHEYDAARAHYYPYASQHQINLDEYVEVWNVSGSNFALTADINGDDLKEVVCTNEAVLRAFDCEGTELWSTATTSRINLIADVTGDEAPEIITSQRNGLSLELYVYDNSGSLLKTLSRSGGSDSVITAIMTTDFDNDGNMEILTHLNAGYSRDPRGLSLFDYESGSEIWYYDVGPSGWPSAIGDINNDNILDAVRGGGTWHNGASGSGVSGTATTTTDGDLYTIAFRADTGEEIFTNNYFSDGQSNGWVDQAIADLDHDGIFNVLVFEGHSHWYPGTQQVHLLDGNGSVLATWNGPYVSGFDGHISAWAIADFNNDGYEEIVFKYRGIDSLVMLDHNLNEISSVSLNIESHSIIANDINGDGNVEILLTDYQNNKLRVFDGNLSEIWSYDVNVPTRYFTISDLNADGINEIIVAGDDMHVFSVPNLSPSETDIQVEIRNLWPSQTSPIVLFGQSASLGQVIEADLDLDSFSDPLPNYGYCSGRQINYDKSVVSRFREGDNKVRIVVDITGNEGFNPGSEGYIQITNPEYRIAYMCDQDDHINVLSSNPNMHSDYYGFGVLIDQDNGTISWQGRGGCPACGCKENYVVMEFILEKVVSNNAPEAKISTLESEPKVEGSPITFDASASNDPDGDALTYRWDFNNDGTWDLESSEPTGTHTWNDDYAGTVTLEVSDGELSDVDTVDVIIENIAPEANIISPAKYSALYVSTLTAEDLQIDPLYNNLVEIGFSVEVSKSIPADMSEYNLVIVGSYDACWQTTADYMKEYVGNGGGAFVVSGCPAMFPWPYQVIGSSSGYYDISYIYEWFGSNRYANTGGYSYVTTDNPFGTDLVNGDRLVLDSRGYAAAAVASGSLNPASTEVLARWGTGPIFAFTNVYGDGKVFYVASRSYGSVYNEATQDNRDKFELAGALWAANCDSSFVIPVFDEGETIDFVGTFSDLGIEDAHTIEWNFGDGSTESGTLTPSYVYADNGEYTVTLTVTDDDGGVGTDSVVVTINNVAPVADAGLNQTVDEGDVVSFFGNCTDAGAADTHTFEWDFGDGLNISGTLSPTHVYAEDGEYTVILTATDDDGGVCIDSLFVTVNNVAPTVTMSGDTIDENGIATINGVINDPGTTDTFEVRLDWGDGNSEIINYSAGTTAFSEIHQYLDDDPSGTSFDDYTVNVTVSDDDGGVGTVSSVVTVNNIAPEIISLSSPIDPVAVNEAVAISSDFIDVGTLDTHTVTIEWGDSSVGAMELDITSSTSVGQTSHSYMDSGLYRITVAVTDDDSGTDAITSEQYVVVYDPEGGFVTGGGWIDSPENAYAPDPTLTGKATFGFISKYKKGATVPTGTTEFQFHVADLNFKSINYDWLVVAGSKAKYKGTGTINGNGEYGFMLSAIDGDSKEEEGDGNDKFRMKIWDKATEEVVYDNQIGDSEDTDPSTAIGGGSIVVHKEK